MAISQYCLLLSLSLPSHRITGTVPRVSFAARWLLTNNKLTGIWVSIRHPTIKFTVEIEKDNALLFLDTLVIRNTNGKWSHKVYRRPMHTDRCLYSNSCHHPARTRAVIKTVINRVQRISGTTHLGEERQHLLDVLVKNGYSQTTSVVQTTIFNLLVQRQKKSVSFVFIERAGWRWWS